MRHQNISSPLDGIDGSTVVDKTLLKVSAKIGEAKSKKELAFFNMTKNFERQGCLKIMYKKYLLMNKKKMLNFKPFPFFDKT